MEYIIPMILFAALGILAGVLLTAASKIFAVETDERLDLVAEALPQVNCGACGYSGCADYADAIVSSGAPCNMCKPGGAETAAKIAEIMGQVVEDVEQETAFVRCRGDCNATVHKYTFDGIQSCAACNKFYNGSKTCTSGCLGYGDCVRVCPKGAISIVDRIAVVDKDKCIGCGMCVRECPNALIVLRRKSQKIEVGCSSAQLGKITRKICTNGCIGCGLCAKKCPKGAISVQNNHAVMDYSKCVNCGLCKQVCPMKVIVEI